MAERLMGEVATRDAQIAAHDAVIAERDRVLHFKQTHIDQLMPELALYKRWRYGKRCEQLNPAQASLLEGTMDADRAAIEEEVNALREAISKTAL
ncbi:transposase [Bordetella genomosp. 12]|uniref:transposase n=1 Tax=Bordetella genomosp. 12 TaxID=463035 RepID=UPI001FC9776A|nr:transposase [Bordetella genomosp. 12]